MPTVADRVAQMVAKDALEPSSNHIFIMIMAIDRGSQHMIHYQ